MAGMAQRTSDVPTTPPKMCDDTSIRLDTALSTDIGRTDRQRDGLTEYRVLHALHAGER